jgi:hypothetical protein
MNDAYATKTKAYVTLEVKIWMELRVKMPLINAAGKQGGQ